jgi:hypothetical protein
VDDLYEATNVAGMDESRVPVEFVRLFRQMPAPLVSYLDPFDPRSAVSGVAEFFGRSDQRPLGRFVYVFPRGSMWDGKNALRYSEQIGEYSLDGSEIPVSSSALIFADLLKIIETEGKRAMIISMLVVAFLVFLDFFVTARGRWKLLLVNHALWIAAAVLAVRFQWIGGLETEEAVEYATAAAFMLDFGLDYRAALRSLVVLAPLLVALIGIGGIMHIFDIKLSFYNMIALPTAVGVGIDNSVHLYHRYIEEGRGHVVDVVKNTGPPIFMSTLTTVIGFSGCYFTQHLGLQAIGILCMTVVAITFFTALTFMPALLVVIEAIEIAVRKRRGEGTV